MKAWYRALVITVGLALSWVVLITVEVKAGVSGPLKLIYALSILLAFGGFAWAWLPAQWVRVVGDAQVSKLRVGLLALVSTLVAVGISLVIGMNYKIAIGGTF